MRRLLSSLSLFLLAFSPVMVAALDYSDRTDDYDDTPSVQSEAVAISVLTSLEAVQGYPDGTFHPERKLNRAEFLKIALLSHGGIEITDDDSRTCFPDVRVTDWFSKFVCHAKNNGIVSGYPDGMFHPERNVNYVEALKILSELYSYDLPEPPANERWTWFRAYVLVATEHGVMLPGDIAFDHFLTRGQMARLAVAYRAEFEGELEVYRDAERSGFSSSTSSVSSSKSSSSSSKSSTNSSSSSVSSSSSTSGQSADFPARSRLLVLGERSEPIGSASFFANLEPMLIRGVQVEMMAEYESIDAMYLVDSSGNQIGRLNLDVNDQTNQRWKASFATEGAHRFEKDSENVLGIEILVKGRNEGGESEEMIQMDDFSLTVEGEWTHNTYASRPDDLPYPKHQTVQSKFTSVVNAGTETDSLPLGSNQLVGAFTFRGQVVAQADLRITELNFTISKPSSVLTTSWELGSTDSSTRSACTVSVDTVSCASIPVELGDTDAGPRTLRLFADVTLQNGAVNPFLQLSLNAPGAIGTNGAIRWTDGSGNYTWVEMQQPVARGTRWE